MNRYKDWLLEGERDLLHAENSLKMKDFNWACFAAQQAAEKMIKAMHMKFGQIAWGHSVVELLENLPQNIKPNEALIKKAKILDRYYIPPRYPNAHPSGSAYEYYLEEDAKQAIDIAKEVLNYCKNLEDRY